MLGYRFLCCGEKAEHLTSFSLVYNHLQNTRRSVIWMVFERFIQSSWCFRFESTFRVLFGRNSTWNLKKIEIKEFWWGKEARQVLFWKFHLFQMVNGVVHSFSHAIHSVVNSIQCSTKYSPSTNTYTVVVCYLAAANCQLDIWSWLRKDNRWFLCVLCYMCWSLSNNSCVFVCILYRWLGVVNRHARRVFIST